MAARSWAVLRCLYAVMFLIAAAILVQGMLPGAAPPPPEPTIAAQSLLEALTASGFVQPALVLCYVTAALALLRHRTAPLGLALVGPPVIVIVLFHTLLSGRVLWALPWGLIWLLLMWRYRRAFIALTRFADEEAA